MESWDAIVIGAGISGMCAASLLAGAGKRVLVLEKQDQIGGRATTLSVKIAGEEYRMDNGSFHAITMADRGALGVTYERGPGLDKLKLGDLQAGMALFREDGWWEMKDLVKGENRDDFKRMVESIASMSYEQAELLDTVSFDSWIRQATRRQNVYDFFRGVIWTLTTIPYPEEISAGEVLVTMKMSLDSMHRISSGTFGGGGSINLVKPLAEFITSREGKVCTGMRVSRILIRKGEVGGVAVDQPLLGVGYQYPETKEIESPSVIFSVPIWDLFDFVPPTEFPSWFVNTVRSYKSPLPFSTCTMGINFFMAEPVMKDTHHRVAFSLPHSKLSHQCSVVSASDPTVAPPGREWISVGGGYLNEEERADRSKINAAFEALEEDLKVMYPQVFKGRVLARARRLAWVIDGLKRSPYYTGRHRLPHKAPRVHGLFFAGDTVQTRGCGIDAAARSGVLCAAAVLGVDIPTFRRSK